MILEVISLRNKVAIFHVEDILRVHLSVWIAFDLPVSMIWHKEAVYRRLLPFSESLWVCFFVQVVFTKFNDSFFFNHSRIGFEIGSRVPCILAVAVVYSVVCKKYAENQR